MPVEQCLDLRACATDRCGARHDLGTKLFPLQAARGQPVKRHLVEGRHSAERTTDEMQLVLDNERWRSQRCIAVKWRPHSVRICGAIEAPLVLPVDMAEEGTCLGEPRKTGEFVDSRDDERWQTAVDHLINCQDWKGSCSGECARKLRAAACH